MATKELIKVTQAQANEAMIKLGYQVETVTVSSKPKGRPVGSKNKPKEVESNTIENSPAVRPGDRLGKGEAKLLATQGDVRLVHRMNNSGTKSGDCVMLGLFSYTTKDGENFMPITETDNRHPQTNQMIIDRLKDAIDLLER